MFCLDRKCIVVNSRMCINCCNEVVKLVHCRLTQQLIVKKFILALLYFKVVSNHNFHQMNNLAWKLFFSTVKFDLEAFNFTDVYSRSYFTQRCSCHAHLTSFCMTSHNMKLITTMANCEFNYRLCQLTSRFSSNREDDDYWAKLPFYLKPIIFWIYNSCYWVLFFQMMEKSMSLTMQELSKHSETLCQVWAITNRLYIKMQGPIIDWHFVFD